MPQERLHKILDDLRDELQSSDAFAEEDRVRLHGVVNQIQSALEESGESEKGDDSLLAALDDAALHFETEHPRLTKTLYQISELFRSAGLT